MQDRPKRSATQAAEGQVAIADHMGSVAENTLPPAREHDVEDHCVVVVLVALAGRSLAVAGDVDG